MSANTLLLTGLPRSGTTLCCHILNESPNALALHEPMTPSDLPLDTVEASKYIKMFAAHTRSQVLEKGTAVSRQRNGAVPENPVGQQLDAAGLRVMNVELGHIQTRDLTADFTLVIKHNALFTALLPILPFLCFAVVRNPLSVLASWNSVQLPVNQGRIPAGERYDPRLRSSLLTEEDLFSRQLLILEWFLTRFRRHIPAERTLRYEQVIKDASLVATTLEVEIGCFKERESRNSYYKKALLGKLYPVLMSTQSDIWQYYSKDDITQLYQEAI